LNHNKSKKSNEQINKERIDHEILLMNHKRELENQKQLNDQKEKEKNDINNVRNKYVEFVEKSDSVVSNLDLVCEHLKEYTNATGVYIVKYTKKQKKANDNDPCEESVFTNENTLRFVATNKDHRFLLTEEPNLDSIVGNLFEKKENDQDKEVEEEENQQKNKLKSI